MYSLFLLLVGLGLAGFDVFSKILMTSTMLQHTAENVPKGIIPLENVRVRAVDERDGKDAEFVPMTLEDNFPLTFPQHSTLI